MAENERVTALGDLADWFDRPIKAARGHLKHPVASVIGYVPGVSTDTQKKIELGMDFYMPWLNPGGMILDTASSYVDVLRIGDGVQEGGAMGYLSDGLRIMALIPLAGRVVGRAKPVLGRLTAMARTLTQGRLPYCGFYATLKSLRMSGHGVFVPLADLLSAGEVLGRTRSRFREPFFKMYRPLTEIFTAVRRMGIPFERHTFTTIDDILRFTRRNPNGVMVVDLVYDVGGQRGGHALLVRNGKIIDTDNRVFKTAAEFFQEYGANAAPPHRAYWRPQYFIRNSTILRIQPWLNRAGLLGLLGLELKQAEIDLQIQGLAEPKLSMRATSIAGSKVHVDRAARGVIHPNADIFGYPPTPEDTYKKDWRPNQGFGR
jgi:hypothetical protein